MCLLPHLLLRHPGPGRHPYHEAPEARLRRAKDPRRDGGNIWEALVRVRQVYHGTNRTEGKGIETGKYFTVQNNPCRGVRGSECGS